MMDLQTTLDSTVAGLKELVYSRSDRGDRYAEWSDALDVALKHSDNQFARDYADATLRAAMN